MAILTSDKIYFETNTVIRDKEEHAIVTKRPIHQENITIKNKYTHNRTQHT